MNTPNKLFLKRLMFEWKNILSNWKNVIDWTVALYIVIPYGIFVMQQYLSWWRSAPNWLDVVPFNLFISVISLFAWSGTIRLFIKEADQLFLWSKDEWIAEIIKRGITYSIVFDFIFCLLFFTALAPFFIVRYEVSLSNFVVLFFLTFLSKVALSLLKHLTELCFSGFKQVLVLRGTFIFTNIVFVIFIPVLIGTPLVNQLFIVAFLIALNWFLTLKRISSRGGFLRDVERERNEELKYVRVLLIISGASFPKQRKKRLRPLLFRHSNLIFKKRTVINGLVELCIKSTLRNKTHLLHYTQLVISGLLVIGVFPATMSLFIWFGLAFILTSFLGLFWKMPMDSNFVRLFKWKEEDIQYGSQKFLFIMTQPGFLIISFFAGFKVFSWVGALAILPISVFISYLTSRIVSFYFYLSASRQKMD